MNKEELIKENKKLRQEKKELLKLINDVQKFLKKTKQYDDDGLE